MKKKVKNNLFFLLLIAGILIVFINRYVYISMPIVSNPDSQIILGTCDVMFEQTWQPTSKIIKGIQIPYYAENDFSCDVEVNIFTDDYSEKVVNAVQRDFSFKEGESGIIELVFDRTNVVLGERYRIQVSLLNSSEDGVLRIPSGSNYGGCTISGESVNQAVALTISVAKYSKLFWCVAVLFPLFTLSLLLKVITGRELEDTIALSLFWEGIVLFVFGLFEQLVLGINIVYILSILFLFIAIILNNGETEVKNFVSPGVIVFLVMFFIIIVCNNGEWLSKRDDVKQWGIMVRDMFFYDSFAKHINTTVILPRYLPFATIIEYVFVYMNGMYSEDILLIAYQTMILCVLLVLCKPLQKKCRMTSFIPIVVTMICVPVIFFNDISSCIMVDALQAVILAYVLICYYSEEMSWFNRIRIACALVTLTLIKDVGLIFACMAILIMLGDMVIKQFSEKKICIKKLLYPLMCICAVLITYISWQFYLSIPAKQATESGYQFAEISEEETTVTTSAISASGVTVRGLINVLSGNGEPYQNQVTDNFLIELFDGETYTFGSFSISFIDLLMIIASLVITLGYFGFWKKKKSRMYLFAGLSIVASGFLCMFMLVTYWFTFPMYEALDLTSFGRYFAPYLCALVIAVLYFMTDEMADRQDNKKVQYILYGLLFILVISMPVAGIVVECNEREGYGTSDVIYGHDEIAEILRSTAQKGDRVYFICTNSSGYSEYIFRNAICPLVSEHKNWNLALPEESLNEQYDLYNSLGDDDNTVQFLSVEDWKQEIKKCKYVVVFHANELFKRSYAEVFEEPEEIDDGSVYQIVCDKDDVQLQLIGKVGIKQWQ